jgi:hypothetical protein
MIALAIIVGVPLFLAWDIFWIKLSFDSDGWRLFAASLYATIGLPITIVMLLSYYNYTQ